MTAQIINNVMKRLLSIVLFGVLSTGCSSMQFEHGKFYLTSDLFPTITNDGNYQKDKSSSSAIYIRGGIQYRYRILF
jgi:hypothetical protein